MRKKILLLLVIGAAAFRGTAQDNLPDTSFASWVQSMPKVVNTVAEAKQNYAGVYGKKKTPTPATKYADAVNAELNTLYFASKHKSIILSTFTNRLDNADARVDFSKIKNPEDAALRKLVDEVRADFFYHMDNHTRAINSAMDSLNSDTSPEQPEKLRKVYQSSFNTLVGALTPSLKKLNGYLQSRGYYKVMRENNSSHPNFIQILECRATILYYLKTLAELVNAANGDVATRGGPQN